MAPSEVLKAQELVYELRIGEVMTRRLISATPGTTMRQVKNLLRDHRISGMPVLEGDALVGIISVEDLILALEAGALDAPLRAYMTAPVYTIREDEFAVRALSVFSKVRVGRLPVVNADGKLVGILTPGDVTRGVLRELQKAYHEEEIRRYRASHLFEDISSERTSLVLRYEIAARDFSRAGRASSRIKQALNRLGIEPRIVRRVAITAYEAEMNVVIHSSNGGEMVVEITPEAVVVVASDNGPGIPDIAQAMQPGWSTAPDWIREMGFGAGMGLANIQNCADMMYLDAFPRRGTRLEAVISIKPAEEKETHEAAPDR